MSYPSDYGGDNEFEDDFDDVFEDDVSENDLGMRL